MNPDGMHYLDLASDALSGGPSKLVNGYWSPGYPALISIAIVLFRPSSDQEFPLIHFVNFLIFFFAVWAFSVFLRYWLQIVSENTKSHVTPFAFSTFLWFTLNFIGVELVTPDLGVAAIVFLAAGVSCRLSLPEASWKHYVALGFVLAVGYYFKAAMFPLGLAFLALLFVLSPFSSGVNRLKLLLSLSMFLVAAAPLVAALSIRANRPSFGETGRINYAWYVNGLRWSGGREAPNDINNTTLEHPAPKLLRKPVTLEFTSPIGGTYPLGYEPSYWYAGTKARFDLRQQIAALRETLRTYRDMVFGSAGAFISGAIVLWWLTLHEKVHPIVPRSLWWQLAWPLAAFSMYAFVHVEDRFVGAFFVLLWLAVYGTLMCGVDRRVTVAVLATVLCTVMVPFSAKLAMQSARIARDVVHPRSPEYQTAALGLGALGLRNGDHLAIVGYANNCYYARFARLRVVAQIPNTQEFWRLSTPELKVVAQRLTSIGVKAVVASNGPDAPALADWKDVKVSDSLRLRVLLLSPEVLGKIR
jgi:hypothetical protein